MSDGCIFCKIAAGEIPSSKVHEDDEIVAFHDIDPKAPTHILVVPRRHLGSLDDVAEDDAGLLGRMLLVARSLAREQGLAARGYRVVNNCGEHGGQAVQHIHLHLLGGRRMGWPPG